MAGLFDSFFTEQPRYDKPTKIQWYDIKITKEKAKQVLTVAQQAIDYAPMHKIIEELTVEKHDAFFILLHDEKDEHGRHINDAEGNKKYCKCLMDGIL